MQDQLAVNPAVRSSIPTRSLRGRGHKKRRDRPTSGQDMSSNDPKASLFVRSSAEKPADVDVDRRRMYTATWVGHSEIADELLAAGADLHQETLPPVGAAGRSSEPSKAVMDMIRSDNAAARERWKAEQ